MIIILKTGLTIIKMNIENMKEEKVIYLNNIKFKVIDERERKK